MRTYLRNISEVEIVLLTRIRTLLDKIRLSEVETTYRKSFFMEQLQASLSTRIVMCNFFILSYVALMVFIYKDQLQDPVIAGTLIVFLITVFGLSYIIQWITSLPLSLNVYTEWGYDPTESKQQWYFIIPIGTILLWVLVKYLS